MVDSKNTPGARLAAVLLVAAVAACWPPSMASAVGNRKQLLIGGGSGVGAETLYTAPGLSTVYEGLGIPANVPMPAGILSALKVLCVVDTGDPGDVSVTIQVQGTNTALTCSCSVNSAHGSPAGSCASASRVRVRVGDGELLQVKIVSSQPLWNSYSFT